MSRMAWVYGVFAAGALFLSGCSDDSNTTTAGEADGSPRGGGDASSSDECTVNADCDTGQTCNLNSQTCTGPGANGCQIDDDCSNGKYCNLNLCNADCTADAHCPDGEVCGANKTCVTEVECNDADGDGYGPGCDLGADCDDSRADVNPGITEDGQTLCGDGLDNDCDGSDSACGAVDADGDGFIDRDDCDDSDASVNPDASEIPYNGKDDDCDAATRDEDVDGDGFRGTEVGGDDCDDRAVHINPEATDVPGNGVDEDCDGSDREPTAEDGDGDGVSEADGDCDDSNASIFPGAMEIIHNGQDDDCDPETLDNDIDGDGIGDPQDCDDNNAAVNPNADEIYYNGIDDDCDPATVDTDQDGDGFAGGEGGVDCNDQAASINPDEPEKPYNGQDDDCNAETPDDDIDLDGFPRETDCDDADPTVNPDAVENAELLCDDGIDHDCRGGDVRCEENAPDADGDGIPDDQDCAPENPAVPGPDEIPGNGIDDDCNPATPDEVVQCADDVFEEAGENDTPQTASAVEDGNTRGVQYAGLVLCAADVDFYRIDLQAGDGVEFDVFFEHTDAVDVDITLTKIVDGGDPQFVDASLSVSDNETVYERRASVAATYILEVVNFTDQPADYALTVNLFSQCQDDAVGLSEQNDSRNETASIPPAGTRQMICDWDDDWYSFTIENEQDVRLDLVFNHNDGDLDMALYADDVEAPFVTANSSDNDEFIEQTPLSPGLYHVRIYGFRDATAPYYFFRTTGQQGRQTQTMPRADVPVPDFADGEPSVTEVSLDFDPPAGAVIRNLTIQDLDINHGWLRDLRVTALWDGVPIVTLWNRDGDANGKDGGLDDDFLPFTGGDINFDNRQYRAFTGLPANGRFTLRVEDLSRIYDGEIADLDVRIDYLIP